MKHFIAGVALLSLCCTQKVAANETFTISDIVNRPLSDVLNALQPFRTSYGTNVTVHPALAHCQDENCQNAPAQKQPDPQPTKRIADLKLKTNSFTFVRVKYSVDEENPGHSGDGRWMIDYPGSDKMFSAWFTKITGIKTETNIFLELSDPKIKGYPFLYLVEPGRLKFTEPEITALRAYLLGGGFLMLDDFWGEREWEVASNQLQRVFPERSAIELPITHELFHCLYDIQQKPQVPNVALGIQSQFTGVTWERSDAKEPHFKGILDDKGRIMVLVCHNTDLGDGWEHVNEDEYYSREFSRKKAYPMGINTVIYALTH